MKIENPCQPLVAGVLGDCEIDIRELFSVTQINYQKNISDRTSIKLNSERCHYNTRQKDVWVISGEICLLVNKRRQEGNRGKKIRRVTKTLMIDYCLITRFPEFLLKGAG